MTRSEGYQAGQSRGVDAIAVADEAGDRVTQSGEFGRTLKAPDRVKPAASHVPSGTVDKAGLELSGPADGGIVVLQYDRAYQASEGE